MNQNAFRPLNENEFHMLAKFGGIQYSISDFGHFPSSIIWEKLTVSYEIFLGGFTVCLLRFYANEFQAAFVWRGVSRCARGDKFNTSKAEALAFKRAVTCSWPVEI